MQKRSTVFILLAVALSVSVSVYYTWLFSWKKTTSVMLVNTDSHFVAQAIHPHFSHLVIIGDSTSPTLYVQPDPKPRIETLKNDSLKPLYNTFLSADTLYLNISQKPKTRVATSCAFLFTPSLNSISVCQANCHVHSFKSGEFTIRANQEAKVWMDFNEIRVLNIDISKKSYAGLYEESTTDTLRLQVKDSSRFEANNVAFCKIEKSLSPNSEAKGTARSEKYFE